MKKLTILIPTLICLANVVGCVHQRKFEEEKTDMQKPLVSPAQIKMLESIELNNEFVAGCVTEEIADLAESLCENSQQYCEGEPGSQFEFDQWVTIYQSCIAN